MSQALIYWHFAVETCIRSPVSPWKFFLAVSIEVCFVTSNSVFPCMYLSTFAVGHVRHLATVVKNMNWAQPENYRIKGSWLLNGKYLKEKYFSSTFHLQQMWSKIWRFSFALCKRIFLTEFGDETRIHAVLMTSSADTNKATWR